MDHVERTGRGQTPDQTSLVELESQFDFDFEDDQLVKEAMYSIQTLTDAVLAHFESRLGVNNNADVSNLFPHHFQNR